MPYIKQEDRPPIDTPLESIVSYIREKGITWGELNYIFTRLALAMHAKNYDEHSDVIKTFECAKLEYYRRKIVPLEESKKEEHGDVY